jgi:hypothetical protein
MLSFIIFTLFLSSIDGFENEGENSELSVLFKRLAGLEERLRVQERINEEQEVTIKDLILEKEKRPNTLKTETVMPVETEQNGGGQWPNGELDNGTISGEGARGVNVEVSADIQSFDKDSKKNLPKFGSRIQRGSLDG